MKFTQDKLDKNKKKKVKQQQDEEEKISNDDTQFFPNLYNPSNKVHCNNCEKDITKHVQIYCAECKDTDICVNCFADGVEFDNHKNNHEYYIINKLNFPMFTEDWTAEEELLLYEALERFGFGNWEQIAEQIATDKNAEDVEKHYEEIYLQGDENYLPKKQILAQRDEHMNLICKKPRKLSQEESMIKGKRKNKQSEKQNNQQSQTGNRTTALTTPSLMASNQIENASEIVGYMPKRGDFDIEYDNDAELLLAEMEFNEDDKESDMEMKFKLLDIYNARLDERIKRKKFVIERGLLDLKKQNQLDKERTKEEKEIYNMMKVFSRFSTPQEHEQLVQGIIKERQLRQQIEELRTYRKLGMKTIDQVEQFLADKKKKDEQYQRRQQYTDSYYAKPTLSNRSSQRKTRSINQPQEQDKNKGHENYDKKKQFVSNINEQEQQLCEKLGITPYDYIIIKEVLIRESVNENFVKRDYAENKLKIDKDRLTGIFDFLVTHNYIMEKK